MRGGLLAVVWWMRRLPGFVPGFLAAHRVGRLWEKGLRAVERASLCVGGRRWGAFSGALLWACAQMRSSTMPTRVARGGGVTAAEESSAGSLAVSVGPVARRLSGPPRSSQGLSSLCAGAVRCPEDWANSPEASPAASLPRVACCSLRWAVVQFWEGAPKSTSATTASHARVHAVGLWERLMPCTRLPPRALVNSRTAKPGPQAQGAGRR